MESLNEEFCSYLEYRLSRFFDKTDREELKGFWCDGISWHPSVEHQISKEKIRHTRTIETKTWLGKTGQDEYTMTIWLGEKSFEKYLKGESMIECIPNETGTDWIEIAPDKRTIAINLD